MTSFVHIDQSVEHLGVNRAAAALRQIRGSKAGTSAAAWTARIVIAAGIVLLALANQLATGEVDGGWMVAWVAICAMVLGLGALSVHRVSSMLARWSASRAVRRADAQLYEFAKYDPRILRELQAAVTRHEAESTSAPVAASASARVDAARMPTLYEAMARLNGSRMS